MRHFFLNLNVYYEILINKLTKKNEMETINNIGLTDESTYPDEQILKGILGKSYNAYEKLLELYNDYEMDYNWRYYKDGKAWLCKVQKKKNTIVWMSAWKGYMQAAIYLPEKQIDEIYKLDISKEVIEKLKNTKKIGKSVPCIFEIRNMKVIVDFKKVMQFKLETKK